MGMGLGLGRAAIAYEEAEELKRKRDKERVMSDSTDSPAIVDGNGISDAMLLDSLSINEGTYKTGYNTEYAYGKNGSPRKNFNEMTINEVMDYQDTMRGDSTAVGRYQMLRQTLDDAVSKYGFSGDDMYTDDMQDKIIMNRLKKMRGYDDWRSGNIDDDAFKHNLSKEFASVQNPYTGRGYYPNQNAKPLDWSL